MLGMPADEPPGAGMQPGMNGFPGMQPGMPPGMPPGMMPGGMPPGAMPPGMMPGVDAPEGYQMPAVTGPRLDATGLTARINFPNEEQNYRVEVTVRDPSRRKETVKKSILVKVRA